jgi:teichuronic acid biosynthesis glycosyltransferase TuaG
MANVSVSDRHLTYDASLNPVHIAREELVSIITPAYRCAGVVDETIKSVIAQTYPNWEMLIAEDCSPDSTRDVIERWTKVDPRIKLIKLNRNGGPALARNAALELAKGRWIAFLDSDDLWLPQKLEQCLEFAQQRDAGFVFTGFRRFPSAGGDPGRYIGVPATLNYRQLLGNTAIATSTVMLDTERTGQVRMRETYYDDFDCWLQILKRGITAHGLDADLMRYRIMEKSISRNKGKSALKVWRAYRDLEGLSIPLSVWYFIQYSLRGVLKYL